MDIILFKVMKQLSLKGIQTSIEYNRLEDKFFLDLQTMSKSDLHLYSSGEVLGRYGNSYLDLSMSMDEIVESLAFEVESSMCGRDYMQEAWMEMIKQLKQDSDDKR